MRFAGYAARWDRVDRAGDVFRAGAFAAGTVPLLWQHRGAAIGTARVTPDATGLRVEGVIRVSELTLLVRCGALRGLSVGYRPRVVQQGAWRELLAVDLIEVSLVARPMQAGATIECFCEENEDG